MNKLKDDPQASHRERTALERLKELNDRALTEPSAKYTELLSYLKDIGVSRNGTLRAVVFAERVPTLRWLEAKLAQDLRLKPEQVRVLHGGLSDIEQQEIVESFKLESSPIRLLITGDVASEGVNLHTQCHHLVHYDIPWSLIRIEQRNGRIDRYGQRHRPQIITLLLNPDTERFAGDIRVLTRLVQREHEAHRALGDSASLMGTYDVKAEEDAILDVIRGRKQFDEVVRTPDQVRASSSDNDLIAKLLAMGGGAGNADDAAPATSADSPSGSAASASRSGLAAEYAATESEIQNPVGVSGLYTRPIEFLRDGLAQAYETAGARLGSGGVEWQEHPNYAIASLAPPKDLQQRLRVLPQSYLKDRNVTEKLQLATSKERGLSELVQARTGDSTSMWPEAHFLSPLHPVLDWTADRVLATLNRGEVFAVYGEVDLVTVLLQRTLTNRRGQLVASGYLTAQFLSTPQGIANDVALPMLEVFDNARASIAELNLATINTHPVPEAESLQPYIRSAVAAAELNTAGQVEAIKQQTRALVSQWQDRTARWQAEAEELVQRATLRQQTQVVQQEQEIAEQMMPHRTLVRPLLVVVPPEYSPQLPTTSHTESFTQQGTRHV